MRIDLGADLPALRARLLADVDAAAEHARRGFLTAGSGQALEYLATEAEAQACLAGVPGEWPMLRAEQAALAAAGQALALPEIAARVLAQRATWLAAAAEIKRLRRAAKLAIGAAATPAEALAAAKVAWPRPE